MLLHAGDISLRGKKEEISGFLQWFSRQPFTYKIFIGGNHDFFLERAGEQVVNSIIPENVIYLNDSGTSIGGIQVWGSPITPLFFNWAFNRQRGAAIRKHWELIPPGTDLLITHGPVYGFLDQTGTEQHAGCADLLRKVLTVKPKVHVCGHIHESYGSLKRSGIRFINASLVNEHYDLVRSPIVFDL